MCTVKNSKFNAQITSYAHRIYILKVKFTTAKKKNNKTKIKNKTITSFTAHKNVCCAFKLINCACIECEPLPKKWACCEYLPQACSKHCCKFAANIAVSLLQT